MRKFSIHQVRIYIKLLPPGNILSLRKFFGIALTDARQETEYFNIFLEGIRISLVSPSMVNQDKTSHVKYTALHYEKIN